MGLPKLNLPIVMIKIPTLEKEYAFRPYLVKEEKILLMSKEAKEISDIFISVKQIVNNCIVDTAVNVEKLASFDLEYIFLKLRSASVNNICNIVVTDNDDKKDYEIDIDLNLVKEPLFNKKKLNIKINDSFMIKMKYPTAGLYNDKEFLNITDNYIFELMVKCIDIIYEGDNIYEAVNYSKAELSDFLDNLDSNTFRKMSDVIADMPRMNYELKYKNTLEKEVVIKLENLTDFFTF